MKLPEKYRQLILGDGDPGELYRRCVQEVREDRLKCGYELTETLVYATEVRYAIRVLRDGAPDRWWNFGDPRGDAEMALWSRFDSLQPLRLAFAGSGPYPVTAALVAERYRDAAITCIENSMAAYLLGRAVLERAGVSCHHVFADAQDVDFGAFNAVIVAAMVRGKRALVKRILQESDAFVVVRSRVGLEHRRLLEMPSPFADDGSLDGGLE